MKVLSGKKSWTILVAVFVIAGVFLVYLIDKGIQKQMLETRALNLKNYHQKAMLSFQSAIDEMAALVSGMRAFMHHANEIPDENQFQRFLQDQLQKINYNDSLVVSYLDTNHVFLFSLTPNDLNPNALKGTKVSSLRTEDKIQLLNNMMQSDNLQLFPPMNLMEGWVGIPIDFRVVKDGVVQGYVAPIMNFETAINRVYEELVDKEFIFRFATQDYRDTRKMIEFDRAAVYNDTKIYNTRKDPEYYRNFDIPKDEFLTSAFESYGRSFEVGIAYKTPYSRSRATSLLLYSLLGLVVLFSLTTLGFRILVYRKKVNALLRKQNMELKQYNLALDSFYNASSHDLKEPLRGIGSFTTLLKRRYEDKLDDQAKSFINFIVTNVNKMYEVLEKTRNYTVIIRNKPRKIEKIDLNELLAGLVLDFNSDPEKIKAEFNIFQLPEITGSKVYILNLFYHLIDNAIKFSKNGSVFVEIGYTRKKDKYKFWVKDNGVGVPEDYTDLIFKPFQVLDKSQYEGVGLSLAACKQIVEYHGGQIWAKPNVDGGTTFFFTLRDQ